MAAVASIAVPVFAAALFGVSAVTQGSAMHASLALTALVLAAIGAALYVQHSEDEEVEEPTTGQVVVMALGVALGVVLVMVWGALLVTSIGVSGGVQDSAYDNMWVTEEELQDIRSVPLESENWDPLKIYGGK